MGLRKREREELNSYPAKHFRSSWGEPDTLPRGSHCPDDPSRAEEAEKGQLTTEALLGPSVGVNSTPALDKQASPLIPFLPGGVFQGGGWAF